MANNDKQIPVLNDNFWQHESKLLQQRIKEVFNDGPWIEEPEIIILAKESKLDEHLLS